MTERTKRLFNLLNNCRYINQIPLKMVPIIENKQLNSYIIYFSDIENLSEEYGISYEESLDNILMENNIIYDNYKVAIPEYEIVKDPNIVLEFKNNFIIIPQSNNSIISRYIDYILNESNNISYNQEYFIENAIINDVYFNDFLINEGIIQGVRKFGSDLIDEINDQYVTPFKNYRNESLQNNNSNLKSNVIATSKVAKDNLGNIIKIGDMVTTGSLDPSEDLATQIYDQTKYAAPYLKYRYNQGKDKVILGATNIKNATEQKIAVIKNRIAQYQSQLNNVKSNINLSQSIQNKIIGLQNSLRGLLSSSSSINI